MNWFKFEHATLRKPEVYRIAAMLNVHRHAAVGMLCEWFTWCDLNVVDGHAPFVTESAIDDIVGHCGFASALLDVGWLQVRSGSLVIPHFDRHLSQGSKNRALSGERQRKRRSESVTRSSRSQRDKSVTREEERRGYTTERESSTPERVAEVVHHDDRETSWSDIDSDADWTLRRADFVSLWNDSPHTVHLATADLPYLYEARFRECWRDPEWGAKSAAAISRLARTPIWHGRKLRLEEFLKPTFADELLQGALDNANSTPRRARRERPTAHLTAGSHETGADPRLG